MQEPQEGDEKKPNDSDAVDQPAASPDKADSELSEEVSKPEPRGGQERPRPVPAFFDPLAGVRAQLAQFQSVAAQFQSVADPLAGVRAQLAAAHNPLSAVLRDIAEQAQRAFPHGLLQQLTQAKRLLIPQNLRHLRPTLWPWILRISTKDGVCLAWAPRAEIVSALLVLRTSQERHQILLSHRKEVVDDVVESLRDVDHPKLLEYTRLTEEAAMCIRDNKDAAAQALLGNVLDSCMREHGHTWLTEHFANAQFLGTGSHKMVAGAIATHAQMSHLRPAMFGPYLLVTSMKNAFGGSPRQSTFNRHLGAHKAAMGNYRSEFALGALLITQALLRQIDGHLWAQP